MTTKKVNISPKPITQPKSTVDQWVETRLAEASPEPEETKPKMKRLTLDIPETLHRAIKMKSVEEGVPMADLLRALLEASYL